jgi:ABC-type sugar transport system ATPase subunit
LDQVLLEMKNIHKRFPGVYALRGVSLALNAGEVLALVGENGAGKSTLINVLGGIHPKDEGEIWINGKPVDIDSVSDARQMGVSIIHQELVLVPYLTVAENIFLNREPQQNGFVDYKSMFENAQQFIDGLGLKINASEKIHRLTIAQQQIVEIVKAISFNAKMIVMDEPTSSLSENEIDALFENIKLLKAKGIGIIYISHRLSELPRIADRVVVLRDGQSVGTANIADISNDEIVRMMVGREMTQYYTRTQHEIGNIALQIDHLTSHHIFDVSFVVRRGEILGFAGLVGAGRTEVMKAILGFDPVVSGDISIAGQVVKIKRPAEAYARKIGYIPENRREESLFALRSVSYNLTLRVLQSFIRGVRVNAAKEKSIVDEYSNKLSLKAASYETKIQNLSGGNQQKVVISRWLAAKPEILIMDEPTRGIDVGAKAEIYELMNTLAEQGMAIIMISSELPEVINISDRVLVMREGRVSGVLEKPDLTQEAIMKLAVNI